MHGQKELEYLPNTREQELGTCDTERISASWLPPADSRTAFNPMSGQDCHLVVESGISASWKRQTDLFSSPILGVFFTLDF